MVRYQNRGRNSNVYAYEIDNDRITVSFNGGGLYTYTYSSAGMTKVESMKHLARQGQGLNSFINRHAKFEYAMKH